MSEKNVIINIQTEPDYSTQDYAGYILILQNDEYRPKHIRPDQKVLVICEEAVFGNTEMTTPPGCDVRFVASLQEGLIVLKTLAGELKEPKVLIGKLSPTLPMDELKAILPYSRQGIK